MDTHSDRPLDPQRLLQAAMQTGPHGESGPAPWPAPTLAELAPRFPELTLEDRIGQGGMAAVYRAVQNKLDRRVALKILRPDLARQPEFVARFLREARALAQLSHPHVLTVYDFGERDGICYLLVEYVDGANLRELMALGRLSPAEALRLVPQIASGLQFAHEHGIVHRDVKPENVLVDRQGHARLADFGLAKLVADDAPGLTRSSVVMGTPQYMAPEQWRGGSGVDHRADIYALGVVLYELLTGKLPVGTYEPPSQHPGVPGSIDEVVHRSLEQEPDRRYQSARDVQRDIERAASGAAAASPKAAPAPAGGRSLAGRRILAAAVLATLAALAAFVVFFDLQSRRMGLDLVFEMEQRQQVHLLEAVREAVHRGTAWNGETPGASLRPQHRALDGDLFSGLVVGWIGVGAVMFWAMVWSASRHARAHGDRLLVFAAMVVGLLPIAIGVDAWVGEIAEIGRSGHGLETLIAVALIAISHAWLLRELWRKSASIASSPLPAGRGLVATIAVAAIGQVSIAAVALTLTYTTERMTVDCARPVATESFAGKSRTEVLRVLGPPVRITLAPMSMHWGYYGLDGIVMTKALHFAEGRVIETDPSPVLLVPEVTPTNALYLGMAEEALRPLLGEPTQQKEVGATVESTYQDGSVVQTAFGVVIAFKK